MMKKSNLSLPRISTLSNSLLTRLISRLLLLVALLLVIVSSFQYVSLSKFLRQGVEDSLHSQLKLISPADEQAVQDPQQLESVAADWIHLLTAPDIAVVVIHTNGDPIAQSVDPRHAMNTPIFSPSFYQSLVQSPAHKKNAVIEDSQTLTLFRVLGSPNQPVGLLQVSGSFNHVNQILHEQLLYSILASLVCLVMGIVMGIPVLSKPLLPLRSMVVTAEQITPANLDQRLLLPEKKDEVYRLTQAFNTMLERLQSAFLTEKQIQKRMRQFVGDASHELRTPLTSIRGFLEVLQMGASHDPVKLDLALRTMLSESERLSELVEQLLVLARFDESLTLDKTSIHLETLLQEVFPSLQVLAGKRQLRVEVESSVLIQANSNQLKQVLFNLVHNAIQHTENQEKSRIELKLSLEKNEAKLSICDNGVGISEEHLERIFDRFYRGDSDRSRPKGGAGLGLSIVQGIIQAHQGRIEVQSTLGQGATFTLYFPM